MLGKHTGGSLRWLPCEGTVQGLLQGPLGRWAPGPLGPWAPDTPSERVPKA